MGGGYHTGDRNLKQVTIQRGRTSTLSRRNWSSWNQSSLIPSSKTRYSLNEEDNIMITPLTILVHQALPMVYDQSLSFVELQGAVIAKVNEMVSALNEYFTVDAQTAIANILDIWKTDGTLAGMVTESMQLLLDAQADINADQADINAAQEAINTTLSDHLLDDLKFKTITSESGNAVRNALLSFSKVTPYWNGNLPGPYNPTVLGDQWRSGVDKTNRVFSSLFIEENYDLTQVGTNIFTDTSKTPDAVNGLTVRMVVNGISNERAPAGEAFGIGSLIESSEPDVSLYGIWGSVEHKNVVDTGSARLHGMELNVVAQSDFAPVFGSDAGIARSRSAYGVWVLGYTSDGSLTAAYGFTGNWAYGLLGMNGSVQRAFLHFPGQDSAVAIEPGNMGRVQAGGTLGDSIHSPSSTIIAPKLAFGDAGFDTYMFRMNDHVPELIRNGTTTPIRLNRYAKTEVVDLTSGAEVEQVTIAIPEGVLLAKPDCGFMIAAEDVQAFGSYMRTLSSATAAVFNVRRYAGGNLPQASVRFSIYVE